MELSLSRRERDIISCVQLAADRPLSEVAKETNLKLHTVRYVIQDLLERRILKPYPVINLYPLGLMTFDCFCSAKFQKPSEREQFVALLKQSSQVVWINEVGGDHQYGFSIASRRPEEVPAFLAEVAEKFGNVLFEKEVSTSLGWTIFRRKYLSNIKTKHNAISIGFRNELHSIDVLDHKILVQLCNMPTCSAREIAQHCGVARTTVEYRLKRLMEKNILLGSVYAVECDRFGYLPFRAHLSLRGRNNLYHKRLFDYAASHPFVTSCIESIGSWDLSFRCEVPTAFEATKLQRDLYDNFPDYVSQVKILPIACEHMASSIPNIELVMG